MEANKLTFPQLLQYTQNDVCIDERVRVMKALAFDYWDYLEEIDDHVDQSAFIDTLLIEHFLNTSSVPKSLRQLLYGYIDKSYRPIRIKVVSNKDGVVYLPKIGYYLLEKEGIQTYYYFCTDDKVQIFDIEGNEIKYTFESISYVKELEVLEYIHPLLYHNYIAIDEPIVLHNSAEVKTVGNKYNNVLESQIQRLEEHGSEHYENLLLTRRRVFISNKSTLKPSNDCSMLLLHTTSFDNDEKYPKIYRRA